MDSVEKVAEAVLYEGYLLYPYRRSAMKNQQRWTFDPARPFSAQLKSTLYLCLMYDPHCQNKKVTGTLKIDS